MAKRGRPAGPYLSYYMKNKDKGPTKTYDVLSMEERGKGKKEPKVVRRFWKEHKMEEVEFLSDEDLSILIESFMTEFIQRQIKQNKRWNFPE